MSSSPNIKFQSLIRKLKNNNEIQKLVSNYTYDITSEIFNTDLNTMHMFQSKGDYDYTIIPVLSQISKSAPITIIHDYIGKGHLYNIYNTELCDENWLIHLYCISNISNNFMTNNKVKVKSLHINQWSSLSAFNHFLHNSISAEWDWLNILNSLNKPARSHKSKTLTLIENNLHSVNNINYIINESNKFTKINFLTCDTISSINDYITYIILTIKCLDVNGIAFIKIPQIQNWDTQFINVLILYNLIFSEVYIYKFSLITESTFLLCKGKKKINNEIIYKKLIHVISNKDFANRNLFSKIFVDNFTNYIFDIIDQDGEKNSIVFNDLIKDINNCLNVNVNTFM